MAASLLGAGFGLARFVPTETPLGPLFRMIETPAPLGLGAAMILAVAAMGLGARVWGGVLVVVLGLSAAELGWRHQQLSQALTPALEPDIRVLFFNLETGNPTPPETILTAILDVAPDIVVLAEPEALRPVLPRLEAEFAFVSDCPEEDCALLVAAVETPVRFWRLPLSTAWPDRYAVLEYAPDRFLAMSHLSKPWFSGIIETELPRLAAQYNWLPETAVAVGDFNMPPWSRPARQLLSQTGFAAQRWPLGTWPSESPLRLPIDQVLTRGAARVIALEPFGAELGSNHLGLIADIGFRP